MAQRARASRRRGLAEGSAGERREALGASRRRGLAEGRSGERREALGRRRRWGGEGLWDLAKLARGEERRLGKTLTFGTHV